MKTVSVTLNYLGVPIKSEYIDKIFSSHVDTSKDTEYLILENFFGICPKHLPREVLERYIELTDKNTYLPFFPHTNKIFERLLSPFKSAKRCYCLGEYIATIELCAHLGEMLALLLWQMTPLTHNDKSITPDFEKSILGDEFEKLRQDRRIKILKAFGAMQNDTAQLFDDLRTTRRKYFHLWSSDVSKAKKDAYNCFHKVAKLIKKILKMEINKEKPNTFVMHPLLLEYLKKNPN